jgi:hypothetical protein
MIYFLIESSTTGQSKNKMWKQERCKRLQASNFGRICKATERTNFINLADSLTVFSGKLKPLQYCVNTNMNQLH